MKKLAKIKATAELLGYKTREEKAALLITIENRVILTIYSDLSFTATPSSEALITKLLVQKIEEIKNGTNNQAR